MDCTDEAANCKVMDFVSNENITIHRSIRQRQQVELVIHNVGIPKTPFATFVCLRQFVLVLLDADMSGNRA